MSPQYIEKNECVEFLEYIRHTLAIEPVSTNWDLETDIQDNILSH